MDKLPSVFNDLWEFLFIPVIELLILLGIIYFIADKAALKTQTASFIRNLPDRYKTLNEKALQPLGINTVFSIGLIIVIITGIVSINRIDHIIGELIPGDTSYTLETALVRFGDWDVLSKVWSNHPYIEDVHALNNYITGVIYKEGPAYPELTQMIKSSKEQFSLTVQWLQFEKFLLIYVIIIIPFIFSFFKIKKKAFFVKFNFLILCVIASLCLNYFHTYTSVKRMTQANMYACQIILAPELSKTPNNSAKVFLEKIEHYKKLTGDEFVVRPNFSYIFE